MHKRLQLGERIGGLADGVAIGDLQFVQHRVDHHLPRFLRVEVLSGPVGQATTPQYRIFAVFATIDVGAQSSSLRLLTALASLRLSSSDGVSASGTAVASGPVVTEVLGARGAAAQPPAGAAAGLEAAKRTGSAFADSQRVSAKSEPLSIEYARL